MELTCERLIKFDLIESKEKTLDHGILYKFFSISSEIQNIDNFIREMPSFPGSTDKIIRDELISVIGGTLSVNGGDSRNTGLGGCFDGADGGTIFISYGTIAVVSGATFHYNPGTASSTFSCSPEDGTPGSAKGEYWGPPNPTRFVEINESEPNNSQAEGQHIQNSSPVQLFPPVRIRGMVSPLDVGDIGYNDENGQRIDDLEDVYVTWIPQPTDMTIFLIPGSSDVDLDLFVIDVITWEFFASSTSTELGATENLQNLSFPAGIYLICVSQFGDQPQRDTAYTLTVSPVVALDGDLDRVAQRRPSLDANHRASRDAHVQEPLSDRTGTSDLDDLGPLALFQLAQWSDGAFARRHRL